jgi:hypothetical protein
MRADTQMRPTQDRFCRTHLCMRPFAKLQSTTYRDESELLRLSL